MAATKKRTATPRLPLHERLGREIGRYGAECSKTDIIAPRTSLVSCLREVETLSRLRINGVSSERLARIASRILDGKRSTKADVLALAGCVLRQAKGASRRSRRLTAASRARRK